jgi:O-antigen ligase
MWRTIAALGFVVVVLAASSIVVSARGNACFNYLSNTLTAMTVHLPGSLQLAQSLLHVEQSPAAAAGTNVKRASAGKLDAVIPMGGDTATSFAFRGVMARIAWHFAVEHPFTGIGLGTMHVHVMAITGQTADVDAHNMTMTVLAETGFVGLALFAWCIGWCAWTAFVAFTHATGDPLRALRAGLLVALLAFLVMTLSFDGQRQRVLWTLLAVIYASSQAGALSTVAREAEHG